MLRRNMMTNSEAAKPLWFTCNVPGPQASRDAVAYNHLSCTSHQPACAEGSVQLQKYCLGGWGRAIPFPNGEAKHLYLYRRSCFPKVPLMLWENNMHEHISLLAVHLFCSKIGQKNNLLLRELLSALMHRAKGEAYSRGDNFNHTHTHRLQKRCPFHYKAITLQGCFLPAHNHSDTYLSIAVTASALWGLCQLHCIHKLGNTDKLA